jgi:hypothetical protein
MSEAVHEYHHGDQNVTENEATFEAFGGLMKWSALSVAVLVTMLVLWFCTSAGFWAGLFAGVIIAALGIYFLRGRPMGEEEAP